MPKPLPIIAIPLPTPWPAVGPILTYLIRQDPITLIDAGLHTEPSREALVDGLRANGLSLRDIRRVFITHVHMDHFGQAAWIQAESGASVSIHPDEVGKLTTPDWWQASRQQAMADAGAPTEVQAQMNGHWEQSRTLTLPLTDWQPLAVDQPICFEAGELQTIHMPGHALGHTTYWERESAVLIGGDHLLVGITPNPVMEPLPPGRLSGPPHAPDRALTLGQFLTSLEQVIAMPVREVYPGHGPVITDHATLARSYIAKHNKRLNVLWERIRVGATAYALTREYYPRVKGFDTFLALSEVMAHLDLLVVQGRAVVETGKTGLIFRAL